MHQINLSKGYIYLTGNREFGGWEFDGLYYRFSIVMTVIMMMVSAFMVVYSIVIFTASDPVAGWTTTILFLSLAFFGLFGILTIVIKYLQLLVNLIFKKKHYNFEGIEKLTK